jgi:uncharacterized RDD family membrane protein YckC
MQTVEINTAFNVGLKFEYAIFYKRILAYAIDFAILIFYLYFMKFFLYTGLNLNEINNEGLDIILISLPMLFYSLICELLMNGQTIGKKILKIRVISLEGGEPTLGQFILRWITKFFEWPFLFGYIALSYENVVSYIFITAFFAVPVVILVLSTKKKQRLGDLAAGTTVIQTKTELSLNDTIFINVVNENYIVTFPEVMKLSDNDINTINTILNNNNRNTNYDLCQRVEYKVKDVLQIKSNLYGVAFLRKLMEDYNYLATKE